MNIQDGARGQWEAESKRLEWQIMGGGVQDKGERETKRKIKYVHVSDWAKGSRKQHNKQNLI